MAARAFIIASLAGASCGLALPAFGQNALGDGTALDANQQVGAGRVNPARPSMEAELRFRNAIVTGNAPGGLSFRGDTPYSAPREFRGSLGSDALFEFRRDSFYSGLAGMGIRGTDALQYQFALTTGNTPPPNLRGSMTTSRSGESFAAPGADASRPIIGAGGVDLRTVDEARLDADPRGQALWTLRSPAAYESERRLDPAMLSTVTGPDGQPWMLTASPLRSVALERAESPQRPDQRSGQRAGQREEGQAGTPGAQSRLDDSIPIRRFETYMAAREPLETDWSATPGAPGAEGDAQEASEVASWKRTLDEISAHLQQEADARPQDPAAQGAREQMESRLEGMERLLDAKTIEALRQAPGEYDTLWQPSARDFDAYTTHMSVGERMLGEGRYFEAEERFTQALAVKPGDSLAAAGRIHAELGAGLFLSAALNLREMLTEHPEMIGARYQDNLLPGVERATDIMIRLRDNMQRDPDGPLGRQSALLAAYLGFHTDNPRAVREGLARMRAGGDDTLADILEKVWAPGPGGQPDQK